MVPEHRNMAAGPRAKWSQGEWHSTMPQLHRRSCSQQESTRVKVCAAAQGRPRGCAGDLGRVSRHWGGSWAPWEPRRFNGLRPTLHRELQKGDFAAWQGTADGSWRGRRGRGLGSTSRARRPGPARFRRNQAAGAQSNLASRAQSMPDPCCTLRLGSIAGGELPNGAHSNRVAYRGTPQ